jgi:hypothetical protein
MGGIRHDLLVAVLLSICMIHVSCVRRYAVPEPIETVTWYPIIAGSVHNWEVLDTVFTETDTVVEYYFLRDSVRDAEGFSGEFAVYPVDVFRYSALSDSILVPIRRELRFRHSGYVGEQVGNVKVLVFPNLPLAGFTWNALQLQSGMNEYREILRIDTTLAGCTSCAFVLLRNDNTAIEYRYGEDLYERNVGLYQRWEKDIEYRFEGAVSVLVLGRSLRRIRI